MCRTDTFLRKVLAANAGVVTNAVNTTYSGTRYTRRRLAFKKNIAKSCGVDKKDVKIKKVEDKASRRMLRILSGSKLDVDFYVDVTEVINEAEDASPMANIEKIEEAMVTKVFEAVKSEDLRQDLKLATGEEIVIVVKIEPRKETEVFVDETVAAENADEIHSQPESGSFDHYYKCAMEVRRSESRSVELRKRLLDFVKLRLYCQL